MRPDTWAGAIPNLSYCNLACSFRLLGRWVKIHRRPDCGNGRGSGTRPISGQCQNGQRATHDAERRDARHDVLLGVAL